MYRTGKYVQFYASDLQKNVMRKIKDNRWGIVAIVGALAAGLVIFFLVKKHYLVPSVLKDKLLHPNQEFIPTEDVLDDRATVLFFYATWCPHSKKAMPEWKRFRQRTFGDPLRYNKIEFEEIDGDSEDNEALVKIYKVEAFPAVRLKANGKTYTYEGRVTETTLTSFLEKFVPTIAKEDDDDSKESKPLDAS
jgi:thiol-disulfide isomerase/thioredoxin